MPSRLRLPDSYHKNTNEISKRTIKSYFIYWLFVSNRNQTGGAWFFSQSVVVIYEMHPCLVGYYFRRRGVRHRVHREEQKPSDVKAAATLGI